jgi:DNA segregation ATPase FtsK/SpoIIIE-like protein
MAFDLALSSDGALQTLVVCEEAHRYIPANINAGFWPTRQAIGRIAKEGRKYGVFLGIITQRPGELDPTILSQCNSFFAMRLSNRKDQEIIAGAFNSGAQSTIGFLPSISNRECIAFGEAVYSPMRMTFETVDAKDLPGANIRENQEAVRAGRQINLDTVINKLRGGGTIRVETTDNDPLKELADPSTPMQQRGAPQPGEQVGGKALRGQNPNAFNVHQQTGGAPTQPRQVPGQQTAQMAPRPAQPAQHAPQPSGMRPSAQSQPAPQQSGAIEERYREFSKPDTAAQVERKPNAGNEIFKAFRAK